MQRTYTWSDEGKSTERPLLRSPIGRILRSFARRVASRRVASRSDCEMRARDWDVRARAGRLWHFLALWHSNNRGVHSQQQQQQHAHRQHMRGAHSPPVVCCKQFALRARWQNLNEYYERAPSNLNSAFRVRCRISSRLCTAFARALLHSFSLLRRPPQPLHPRRAHCSQPISIRHTLNRSARSQLPHRVLFARFSLRLLSCIITTFRRQ